MEVTGQVGEQGYTQSASSVPYLRNISLKIKQIFHHDVLRRASKRSQAAVGRHSRRQPSAVQHRFGLGDRSVRSLIIQMPKSVARFSASFLSATMRITRRECTIRHL
jgi:hypothetical protein